MDSDDKENCEKGVLYRITSPSNKAYIGITKNFDVGFASEFEILKAKRTG